ncbi:HlyD family efflux transporter periplasmic adaptor subunit [Leptolyngbya sp. FACHB-17]|uniref:HlyD family secretion protein n=1 Tax=unclassified Leptolyngbya TaxID=2650499 RepID=UPI0016803201|nr:HlyD family efflux transporter periplasmic adaptor subunit [Leptolyngbya sp. FACHB-17]MBD2081321.1 HlyD family efflux transporter periplasmic adaptor subunit [Leptolyngbya sp. FACHB-17]
MTQILPQPANQAPSAPTTKPSRRSKKMLILPGLIAIAGIGFATWRLMPQPEATTLPLSGRIEADETEIGAKTAGRVTAVNFREGDEVQKNQVVAQLTDEEVNEQLSATAAQVAAARQEEQQARLDIAVAESKIQEAQLNLQQSQGDARGRINQASSTVAAARAQLAQANANVKQAQAQLKEARSRASLAVKDRDRFAQLVTQGAINKQQFDQAQTNVETAQAAVDTALATIQARQEAVTAASEQLSAAQGGFTQTQSTGLNPDIRSAQLAGLEQQRDQSRSRLIAAQAKVRNALANQQQIQRRLDSFVVRSPIHGVVTARPIEPGAVVATGKTLLTVIDLNTVYLRGYIPQGDIGKVRVGQRAQVFLDSNPKQPLSARVAAIDPKASFTPENIYFRDDRVKQVFGVKITIDDPRGYAKPGMPADGEIMLKE